jgi:xylulokinase
MSNYLLSLDLGTTHTKAGLFNQDGTLIKTASKAVSTHYHPSGYRYIDPSELLASAVELIIEVVDLSTSAQIAGVGITSMAETGLLIDKQLGDPRTPFIPWFDTAATPQADLLHKAGDPSKRFLRTGIRPNFKCSLAKLLWLQEENPESLHGATWLSSADYIAFKLSGQIATDYSLAGRTYAFHIDHRTWDVDLLASFDIHSDLFPLAVPSGQPIGEITREAARQTGLLQGTPVAICGHDHICAAFAGTGIDPRKVFDSMGTAEALVGSLDKKSLGQREYRSGLVFGCHVAGGGYYWMGGMSASGGSLNWVCRVLSDPPLSYHELEEILGEANAEPTGIFYFPYLAGSGSPHTDIHVRGAMVGLTIDHPRAELVMAVLEGTAYEAEFIRQAAQKIIGKKIKSITTAGGGTQLGRWMQIKADISGCVIKVMHMSEAALLGAAIVAGLGVGLYADVDQAQARLDSGSNRTYRPEPSRHRTYQAYYNEGYLKLQQPLRSIYHDRYPKQAS